MTDERRFDKLLAEFERVGVDPNSFPAGIDVHPDAAMRILRALPDGAGPAAFLGGVGGEELGPRTPPDGTGRRAVG